MSLVIFSYDNELLNRLGSRNSFGNGREENISAFFTYLGFVVLIFVFFMGSVESHMLS